MKTQLDRTPVIDLHCDLLSYLAEVPDADPGNSDEIGCSIPRLGEGNVKIQVLAIYSGAMAQTEGSVERQIDRYCELIALGHRRMQPVADPHSARKLLRDGQVGCIAAVEGATVLCAEGQPIETAWASLEQLLEVTGRILYIGLTHHGENRFGGGNTTTIGLKPDGRALLDHISGRGIAIDFAHTSDALARDILDHIDRNRLDVPVMASHSNFREIWDHARNLTDEIAAEIIRRGGVIGLNFLREFLDRDNPATLETHLRHGLDLGGGEAMCFGADFFHTASHPDRSRVPFYHPEHEHAGKYPEILSGLEGSFEPDVLEGLAWRNALRFIERIWV
jgi:membrane dipeptidase